MTVKTAAIVGGGVIGGGWAARFVLNGWNVRVFDPADDSQRKVEETLANARRSLPLLADVEMPGEGELLFVDSIAEAVAGADWVQESVPERLDIKHTVYAQIQDHVGTAAVIGSSTSGFKPSELQQGAGRPAQMLVTHPFNPVYLLPLIEVVPGTATDAAIVERACSILTELGMKPLHVRKEIDAHIADRFLEAVWREGLWLINDGIATTEEIDDAIRYGFGLRWGQMGLFETYRIAGGEAGMAHFIAQFGPCLSWPWTKLMDVPELTDELTQKIADQSDQQSGAHSIGELERIRDDNLVAMMRGLKDTNWGAGELLNAHDARLRAAQDSARPVSIAAPMNILRTRVLPSWIDYNGHMTEHRYLQVCSDTSDRLLAHIGVDMEYVVAGHSYYTAETHIVHRDECAVGDEIHTTLQLLSHDEKRLHILTTIHAASDDRVLATGEQMLLHVDSAKGKTCPAPDSIIQALDAIAQTHRDLPRPSVVGRCTGGGG
jgi:carnitine 3-dehydrogenase